MVTLAGRAVEVKTLAFSPSRMWIAAYCDNDVVQSQNEGTSTGLSPRQITIRDGERFTDYSRGGVVNVWDAETGKGIYSLQGHQGIVECVTFSPDSKRLASASHDRTIKLWDIGTGKESHTLKGHTQAVSSVAFSPDGGRLGFR